MQQRTNHGQLALTDIAGGDHLGGNRYHVDEVRQVAPGYALGCVTLGGEPEGCDVVLCDKHSSHGRTCGLHVSFPRPIYWNVKRRDRRQTDYEREEHIQTLERLGRLVVDVPIFAQVTLHRAFVVFMNDYYN